MARLNNAMGSSAGPSLILPGRNTYYNNNNNNGSSSNSNGNMGPRLSLPPPTRSSSSAQTVIDLTDSPPPQEDGFNFMNHALAHAASGPSRGGSSRAEVIDVDALPDSPILHSRRGYAGWGFPQMAEDADIVFGRSVGSRALGGGPLGRAQPHPQYNHGWVPRPRPVPVEPSVLYNRIPDRSADRNPPFQSRFYQELEDPILGHGGRVGRAIPDLHGVGVPRNMPYVGGGGGARSLSMMAAEDMMQHLIHAFPANGHWPVPDGGFDFRAPGQLDYRQRAPGIIREDSPVIDAARVRNIDYKAPQPAKEGFTRSPKESDILVCANCSSELGVGEDGPASNEVWAAKCGHVSRSSIGVPHLKSSLRGSDLMYSVIVVLVSSNSVRFLLQNRKGPAGRHDRRPKTVSLVAK